MVTTSDYSRGFRYISLLFKDLNSNKQYVITAQADPVSGNINIEAVVRLFVINETLLLGSENYE